jgi:hypothetical protein
MGDSGFDAELFEGVSAHSHANRTTTHELSKRVTAQPKTFERAKFRTHVRSNDVELCF